MVSNVLSKGANYGNSEFGIHACDMEVVRYHSSRKAVVYILLIQHSQIGTSYNVFALRIIPVCGVAATVQSLMNSERFCPALSVCEFYLCKSRPSVDEYYKSLLRIISSFVLSSPLLTYYFISNSTYMSIINAVKSQFMQRIRFPIHYQFKDQLPHPPKPR
jgi:hypothetical protein